MAEPPVDSVLAQSNQMSELSREDILKQIFGDIGELIDDFTCAVESTVLLHGRMYITNRFICFYSNLFGLEKKIRIPYSHIKNITKESTAYMIPNAISIATDKRDYLFRSFWDREDCFRILTVFWEKYKSGGPASISAMGRIRASSQPPAVGQSSNNPSAAAPQIASTQSESGQCDPPTEGPSRRMSTRRPASVAISGSNADQEDVYDAESGFRSDRPMSVIVTSSTVSNEESADQFQAENIKVKLKHCVINGVLDISVADFANLFVNENAPYSYKRYHESVKDTNVIVSPWSAMSSALGAGREIKFFKPVNLPGLASTRGVKLQRFKKFGDYGLLVFSSTRLEDVPAADTFSVDDIVAVNTVGENKVNVEITFQVTFLKSTYMKYIIERSTNVEMTKWLEVFFEHLRKISEQFKKGEITLESAEQQAIAEATSSNTPDSPRNPPLEARDASNPSSDIKIPSTAEPKPAAIATSIGGFIQWVVVIVVVIYLMINHFRWRQVSIEVEELHSKLKALEVIVSKLNH